MFRAIILPIFRNTRMSVTACGIMHPRCYGPATSWVHCTTSCNTQPSAPEAGQNNCPKHVELFGIIKKALLLHLVGFLVIYNLNFFCLKHTAALPIGKQQFMKVLSHTSLIIWLLLTDGSVRFAYQVVHRPINPNIWKHINKTLTELQQVQR